MQVPVGDAWTEVFFGLEGACRRAVYASRSTTPTTSRRSQRDPGRSGTR